MIKKVCLCLFLMLAGIVFLFSYAQSSYTNIKNNVIRLHVIANSNSCIDQKTKFAVRDGVLESFSFECDEVCKLKKEIIHKLPEIEMFVNGLLDSYNVGYGATADFGVHRFPTKVYFDVKLPSGDYDALRIVLGDGKGENWWCVMFPPLCFVDGTAECVSSDFKNIVKDGLSDEGFELITNTAENDVKVKFKIVELLNSLK